MSVGPGCLSPARSRLRSPSQPGFLPTSESTPVRRDPPPECHSLRISPFDQQGSVRRNPVGNDRRHHPRSGGNDPSNPFGAVVAGGPSGRPSPFLPRRLSFPHLAPCRGRPGQGRPMYKALLCWRYLRTRFLAFVCIVSVMLGVATLVVVNSVMAGFSTKLKDRLHGLLSGVVGEARSLNGLQVGADEVMAEIRSSRAMEHIEDMTPTVEVFGMLIYEVGEEREKVTIPVHVVGTDAKGRAAIGGFCEYLLQPKRRANPSFDLTDEGLARWRMYNPPIPDPGPPAPAPGGGPPVPGRPP